MFYLTRKRYIIKDLLLLIVSSLILGTALNKFGVLQVPTLDMILFVVITYSVFSIIKIATQGFFGHCYVIFQFDKKSKYARLYSNTLPGMMDGLLVDDNFIEGSMREFVESMDKIDKGMIGFTDKEITIGMDTLQTGAKANGIDLSKTKIRYVDYIFIASLLRKVNPKVSLEHLFLYASYIYFSVLEYDKELFQGVQ